MIELEKAYDAQAYEADIYKQWMDSGYFNPDNLPNQNGIPYSIVLPPPNVTGTLHLGHAFEHTIQDILIRWRRMQGRKTLWLPGTDHAAIATQSKVEKILNKEEGKRKTDLGREAFLKRVEDFAQNSHDTIVNQLKSMGSSLDWSREAYTLDAERNLAVRTAFKAMYDDGLIYRGFRVVNYDPKGQTVISDEEVVHQEREAILYTFKYNADFPIPISTTRPETKVGDTAVAVHPDDGRYQEFIGKEYDVKFCGVPLHIAVVADESVEKDFGTGALGVTPAHSIVDAEIAQRHGLPMKQVINEYGKLMVGGDGLLGQKSTAAREVIVAWLKENNLIQKEETIKQNVATAERTGAVIEPLPKMQWFIAVNKPFVMKHSHLEGIAEGQEVTLKELMAHVITSNQIAITPDHFSKTYFHWIYNLRDWCISRQIWFGHRIPVWYRSTPNPSINGGGNNSTPSLAEGQGEVYCGVEAPEGDGWVQDEDTLDTWFSSGLWTFSTLGWPGSSADLKAFHPTSVVVPGYEILFPWVARMILMTTYHLGTIPFKQVYMHGIVRDKTGRKFSKSLNNGIDPLDMSAQYGTDALRFALVFNAAAGNDVLFDEQKVKGMKHYGNKIWNISRYILMNTESSEQHSDPEPKTIPDKIILDKLQKLITDNTAHMEQFRLHEAAQNLYQFTWYELADVYLEQSKPQLQDEALKANTQAILIYILETILKLHHPYMPFITEVIWSKMNHKKLLMVADWPQ